MCTRDRDGLGSVLEMFRAMSRLDSFRQLPQRLFTDEVVKVIQQRNDLAVLFQLIVAVQQTYTSMLAGRLVRTEQHS